MPPAIAKTFPRVLKRAWQATDPATRQDRVCDATGQLTPHQRLTTIRGDYWVCSHTGQMVRDVFPEYVAEHYDAWWQKNVGLDDPAQRLAAHRRFLARFERHRSTGLLLEVGSGEGLLLQAAAQAGWQAEGNEVSPFAAGHAAKIAGVPVHEGPIERVTLTPNRYDVILCKDVFEHIDQPRAVLAALTTALRPGGVLYLQTLSAQSLSLWAQPTGWEYFAPGHTYIPTLVSLRLYVEAAGLRLRWLKTHGFRSAPTNKRAGQAWWRKRMDHAVGLFAAPLDLGHRVECLLDKA